MLKHKAVEFIKQMIKSEDFIKNNKCNDMDFTRSRKLSFSTMILLIIRKSVKSIQIALNEFSLHTYKNFTITAGAFTKARKKLKHSAFIELNQGIVDLFYEEKKSDLKKYNGYRLLAFDGSKINVPNNKEAAEHFGIKKTGNKTSHGSYVQATYEACYDVLNNISVGNILGQGYIYEPKLASKIIPVMNNNDIGIFDRAYVSYDLMANMISNDKHFVIRCQRNSFHEIQEIFESSETNLSKVINLWPAYKNIGKVRKSNLPDKIKVRLIKITLPTGEDEVLITSLIDENRFSIKDFQEIYRLRWGVETYFSKVKGRLNLENFTGKTLEAIFQDFWATILISNLETIMTEDVDQKLQTQAPPKKINKAISFNAIKNKVFELFDSNLSTTCIMEQLTQLFLTNVVTVRNNRNRKRKITATTVSLRFQRCCKKQIF